MSVPAQPPSPRLAPRAIVRIEDEDTGGRFARLAEAVTSSEPPGIEDEGAGRQGECMAGARMAVR